MALLGGSKDAEFTLIAASHFRWIRSAVAIAVSDVVWEGWGPGVEPGKRASFALNGKPLPFVPYVDFEEEFAGYSSGRAVKMRRFQDKGRAANPAAAVKARIKVENFPGPCWSWGDMMTKYGLLA